MTKAFSDNRMNFYGWLIATILVLAGSLWFVVRGEVSYAIYLVLAAHFGLAAQRYLADVAKSLDSAVQSEPEVPLAQDLSELEETEHTPP